MSHYYFQLKSFLFFYYLNLFIFYSIFKKNGENLIFWHNFFNSLLFILLFSTFLLFDDYLLFFPLEFGRKALTYNASNIKRFSKRAIQISFVCKRQQLLFILFYSYLLFFSLYSHNYNILFYIYWKLWCQDKVMTFDFLFFSHTENLCEFQFLQNKNIFSSEVFNFFSDFCRIWKRILNKLSFIFIFYNFFLPSLLFPLKMHEMRNKLNYSNTKYKRTNVLNVVL